MTRERWMALCFAVGAVCFMVGPIAVYANLVGDRVDSWTFFAGSIPFTLGGLLQSAISFDHRHDGHVGRSLWWAAAVQSVGTLCFNVTTLLGVATTSASSGYVYLVWIWNGLGSVCFLLSGAIAYEASPRHGLWPARSIPAWWEPAVNLIGCILFGISAVGSFAGTAATSTLSPAAAAWGTSLGAVCFFACGVATLVSGMTLKSWRLRRWEHELATFEAELIHPRAERDV